MAPVAPVSQGHASALASVLLVATHENMPSQWIASVLDASPGAACFHSRASAVPGARGDTGTTLQLDAASPPFAPHGALLRPTSLGGGQHGWMLPQDTRFTVLQVDRPDSRWNTGVLSRARASAHTPAYCEAGPGVWQAALPALSQDAAMWNMTVLVPHFSLAGGLLSGAWDGSASHATDAVDTALLLGLRAGREVEEAAPRALVWDAEGGGVPWSQLGLPEPPAAPPDRPPEPPTAVPEAYWQWRVDRLVGRVGSTTLAPLPVFPRAHPGALGECLAAVWAEVRVGTNTSTFLHPPTQAKAPFHSTGAMAECLLGQGIRFPPRHPSSQEVKACRVRQCMAGAAGSAQDALARATGGADTLACLRLPMPLAAPPVAFTPVVQWVDSLLAQEGYSLDDSAPLRVWHAALSRGDQHVGEAHEAAVAANLEGSRQAWVAWGRVCQALVPWGATAASLAARYTGGLLRLARGPTLFTGGFEGVDMGRLGRDLIGACGLVGPPGTPPVPVSRDMLKALASECSSGPLAACPRSWVGGPPPPTVAT